METHSQWLYSKKEHSLAVEKKTNSKGLWENLPPKNMIAGTSCVWATPVFPEFTVEYISHTVSTFTHILHIYHYWQDLQKGNIIFVSNVYLLYFKSVLCILHIILIKVKVMNVHINNKISFKVFFLKCATASCFIDTPKNKVIIVHAGFEWELI